MTAVGCRIEGLASKGFSLLEMLIVVLIMGVLASAAVPKLVTRQHNWQVESAKRQLMHDLRLAARVAVARSQSTTLEFTPGTDRYRAPGIIDPSRPSQVYQVDLKQTFGVDLVSTTPAAAPTATLTWSGHGLPNSAMTIVLASGSAQATVSVSAQGEITSP